MSILKKNKMLQRNRPITYVFSSFGLCCFVLFLDCANFKNISPVWWRSLVSVAFFLRWLCLLNWLWYGYFLNCCQILANPAVYFVKIVIGLWNGELIQVADSLLSKPSLLCKSPCIFLVFRRTICCQWSSRADWLSNVGRKLRINMNENRLAAIWRCIQWLCWQQKESPSVQHTHTMAFRRAGLLCLANTIKSLRAWRNVNKCFAVFYRWSIRHGLPIWMPLEL